MTSSRKTLFVAATVLVAVFGLSQSANAGPIHDLPSCYNHVISVCNETSKHPGDCIESATNACDEEFGNTSAAARPSQFLAPPRPGNPLTGLLLPAVQQAREAAR